MKEILQMILNIMGMIPKVHHPLEDNGAIVLPEVTLDNDEEIQSFVLANVNPLSPSNDIGVDIYVNALQLVQSKIRELNGPEVQ